MDWYDRNRRDLPWREDHDSYRVWVSEIMLQQTRVAAVAGYYGRFLKRFPTVHTLARASEASVLAAWSGLGYYRRALRMHAAARKIVNEHGGKFPQSSAELLLLPGIGRYTAAAIASIAFGEAVATVDGNIERVLERLNGQPLTTRKLWDAAQALLPQKRPGDFNQAMMELGATVCLPAKPRCSQCPISQFCTGNRRAQFHARYRFRKCSLRRNKREVRYALDLRNRRVFMVQRKRNARLMAGMWELPEITSERPRREPCLSLRHSITNTDYVVRVER
ncbi:MAG: A/G-specific adenine glycosylase, partial [Acidobacteriales bacterium]|nr:A/G-specific adenine glycosylase [Terriglobales bacterium]